MGNSVCRDCPPGYGDHVEYSIYHSEGKTLLDQALEFQAKSRSRQAQPLSREPIQAWQGPPPVAPSPLNRLPKTSLCELPDKPVPGVEHDAAVRRCLMYVLATPMLEEQLKACFPMFHPPEVMHWTLFCHFDPVVDSDDSDGEEAFLPPLRLVQLIVDNEGKKFGYGQWKPGQAFKDAPPHAAEGVGGFPYPDFMVKSLGSLGALLSQRPGLAKSMEDVVFSRGQMVKGQCGFCDELGAHPEKYRCVVLNKADSTGKPIPFVCNTSPKELKKATKDHEMNLTEYNMFTNNCQHWVLRMLLRLQARDEKTGDTNVCNHLVSLDRAGGLAKVLGHILTNHVKKGFQRKIDKLQGKMDKKSNKKVSDQAFWMRN